MDDPAKNMNDQEVLDVSSFLKALRRPGKSSDILRLRMLELREAAGLNQAEQADRLGITRASLSHYETGRRQPDYDTLIAFADFHGVTLDSLFGRGI